MVARKRVAEPSLVDWIPPELAAGPDIRIFAPPDLVARIDGMGRSDPDRRALIDDAMITARGNWSRAVVQWASDEGLDLHEAIRLVAPICKPFWP